jgi:hypothetical protein
LPEDASHQILTIFSRRRAIGHGFFGPTGQATHPRQLSKGGDIDPPLLAWIFDEFLTPVGH